MLQKTNIFCAVVFVLFMAFPCESAVLNVPDSYSTIQSAVDAAQLGDLIIISEGTYSPSTNGEVFPIRITNKHDLEIRGVNAPSVIIDMENSIYDSAMLIDQSSQITLGYVTVQNSVRQAFYVTNSQDVTIRSSRILDGNYNALNVFRSSIDIRDNYFRGKADVSGANNGIGLYESSGSIRGNTVTGFHTTSEYGGVAGISSSSEPDYGVFPVNISRNLVIDCDYGIAGHDTNFTIENNTVSDNHPSPGYMHGGKGLVLGPGGSVIIKNNIIVNNIQKGIEIYQINNVTESYNDVWNNGVNYDGLNPGVGDISADPLFVTPLGDYHLRGNSPCINAGDPSSPPDPDGTTVDIGTFYYNMAPPPPPVPCRGRKCLPMQQGGGDGI